MKSVLESVHCEGLSRHWVATKEALLTLHITVNTTQSSKNVL